MSCRVMSCHDMALLLRGLFHLLVRCDLLLAPFDNLCGNWSRGTTAVTRFALVALFVTADVGICTCICSIRVRGCRGSPGKAGEKVARLTRPGRTAIGKRKETVLTSAPLLRRLADTCVAFVTISAPLALRLLVLAITTAAFASISTALA